jgi:DNA-binding NarL/FixJ family response regulator
MDTPWQVLVIEDDELDRELVAELFCLRGRGRVVLTEAPSLKVGLDLLAAFVFDLVLVDTKLPDASALQALRAVGERAPTTPIMSQTTHLTAGVRQAARQRGAYEVVVRGELNPLWATAHRLLLPEPAPTPAQHPAA